MIWREASPNQETVLKCTEYHCYVTNVERITNCEGSTGAAPMLTSTRITWLETKNSQSFISYIIYILLVVQAGELHSESL
jgi:hypothetical protein